MMNGYEALARLTHNRESASIPVMALTANGMNKDVKRGLEHTIRQILDGKE